MWSWSYLYKFLIIILVFCNTNTSFVIQIRIFVWGHGFDYWSLKIWTLVYHPIFWKIALYPNKYILFSQCFFGKWSFYKLARGKLNIITRINKTMWPFLKLLLLLQYPFSSKSSHGGTWFLEVKCGGGLNVKKYWLNNLGHEGCRLRRTTFNAPTRSV